MSRSSSRLQKMLRAAYKIGRPAKDNREQIPFACPRILRRGENRSHFNLNVTCIPAQNRYTYNCIAVH